MDTEVWCDDVVKDLLQVIMLLETEAEAKAFLRDLLTKTEIHELSRRWQAARMLNDKTPYTEIEQATGLSSTTIARISRWLQEGAGGYRAMLKKWGE
jgi:TrpR-related protein YerC/YecD